MGVIVCCSATAKASRRRTPRAGDGGHAPPAAVGLFQTSSSAGPSAARPPAGAASETAFSNIRSYIQHANASAGARRRSPTPGARLGTRRPDTAAREARSLWRRTGRTQAPSLLGRPRAGPCRDCRAATRGSGPARRAGGRYGGPNSPPTASGIGMDWVSPSLGAGAVVTRGEAHARHRGDGHTRARGGRSTVARFAGAETRRRRPPRCPRAPRREFAEGDSRRPLGREQDRRVRGDDGHGATHPADARQVGGPEPAARWPPMAFTNLSSSLNKAAPSSSLHGFRGIQRATPAKPSRPRRSASPRLCVALQAETRARDSRRRALRAAV